MSIAEVLAGASPWHVEVGDCLQVLRALPDGCVQTLVSSPPYHALRDYDVPPTNWSEVTYSPMPGMPAITVPAMTCPLGLEPTIEAFIGHMVLIFREVWRVMRDDGIVWINQGDSYSGSGVNDGTVNPGISKAASRSGPSKRPTGGRWDSPLPRKNMVGQPWRLAFALQADGWVLRDAPIWAKPNPMPGSQRDRHTMAYEHVFMLAKQPLYYFDAEAAREPAGSCRNEGPGAMRGQAAIRPRGSHRPRSGIDTKGGNQAAGSIPYGPTRMGRNVWTIPTQGFEGAHFATFPEELPRRCIAPSVSAHGCCRQCGAPWRRVTEVAYANPGNRTTNGPRSTERRHETPGFAQRLEKRTATLGWEPGCTCDAGEPIGCMVLDIFNGAGTTGVAASRQGCRYLGIELNPTYAEMARARIAAAVPGADREVAPGVTQLGLFGGGSQ